MSYLLDTDVISEIRRARDPNVAAWASGVVDAELHLSVLTVGEIRKGIEPLRPRDPDQAEVFAAWLAQLQTRFAAHILAIDSATADEWGRLNAPADRKTIDSLIAATARVHQLTVVTRNTADFNDCDVPLLNPWSDQATPAPPQP